MGDPSSTRSGSWVGAASDASPGRRGVVSSGMLEDIVVLEEVSISHETVVWKLIQREQLMYKKDLQFTEVPACNLGLSKLPAWLRPTRDNYSISLNSA